METNYLALLIAAFSSLFIGLIWYHPKVMGTIWMKESGMTDEKMKSRNIFGILFMALIYAYLMSFMIQFMVIHQYGVVGAIGGDPSIALPSYFAFMNDYGSTFRTFQHGMIHGFLSGLFLAMPIIGVNALFERKSFKYTLVNGGYWIISFIVMGGIICSMK
jgi:hypothetical protein